MKNHVLRALVSLILATPVLFGQAQSSGPNSIASTPLAIPEEARKHFVMGTTLFKDAKTADDLSQVVSEFKKTVDLAPRWPDARYNLALAKEAGGDYSGAMADFKLYQQFKLPEGEARTVQDKIYTLEARAEKAEDAANAKAAAARAEEAKYGWLLGKWHFVLDGSYWTADGVMLAKRENNQVELRMIQGTSHFHEDKPLDEYFMKNAFIRATVSQSGTIVWEGMSDQAVLCPVGWSVIAPVISSDQRTIEFEQQVRLGGKCTPSGLNRFTLKHE
jgi:hypothetical protein